ncbi:hypothetical protein SUGI_0573130 [Cryptomeria japonica]|uniref:subtilisin-like protease SBT1.7 n=1 Tax=Cryptomeria japonica TaxID=3369 RepID=UPI0024089BFF|nr:subtilisin-like protease SBT1.7 [Cryptomeria japonica]GLJ29049.1 hypothetical protein SUGI_0573130 [Cryptomeria japonica]
MENTWSATFIIAFLAVSVMWLGKAEDVDARKPYIVRMLKSIKPHHFDLHQNWYASLLSQVSRSDPSANELLYTYDTLLHGFAASLSEAEAEAMEGMEGCLAVIPTSFTKISTTHTPEFLGLASISSHSSGLWSQYSTGGKDIIVGMIDTGIWPESKSFKDEGLGPVPARWKGKCESGHKFTSSHCNKKIIGARYYYKGYEQYDSPINETTEYKSPRDRIGHGTHTASTVAGVAVRGTSFFGFAKGTARGMAPEARLAIYKACWQDYCYDVDTVAAMDQAVADGVDIISISIHSSGDLPFDQDVRGIAAFGAMEKGVFVSAVAGNYGPYSSTLSNTAPWMTTVGASSIDRDFPASLVLGDQVILRGTSTFKGDGKLQGPVPLVYVSANNSSRRCLDGSLDPDLVKGKIVVCDQLLFSYNNDEYGPQWKGNVVAKAGGAGMIVANELLMGTQQQLTDTSNLPAITVSFTVGEIIKAHIKSTANNAMAALKITGSTVVGNQAIAPMVAAFSSRGPSKGYPHILKPDMIAPGVNILAAYTGDVADYYFDSGTSMACPHVSGLAALVKAIHPTWSPAAIKSALMTSSYTLDNAGQPIRDSSNMEPANPFAMGAGHVDPNAAVDPGLVYDMAPQDYINFLCSLNYTKEKIALLTKESVFCPKATLEAGDLNYPSFSVVFEAGSKSVQVKRRRVTYVGRKAHAVYQVTVKNPPGVNISVKPRKLVFRKPNDTASYSVTFRTHLISSDMKMGFGEIGWKCIEGGTQLVRSPVAIIW